jgi:uncharacterized protein (TIGR03085 family)
VTEERPARTERLALADLLMQLGPDAPTLCAGWTTRDLAAHLILRERRPDAAGGIMIQALRPHTERVQREIADRPYPELVDMLRNPPWWSLLSSVPLLDAAANTAEFFVHHEDVRRAQSGWEPRDLPMDMQRALWTRGRGIGKLRLRRFPAVVALHAPGYGESVTGAPAPEDPNAPRVRVSGPPGELLMFCFGRQAAARVELTGSEPHAQQLRTMRLGV